MADPELGKQLYAAGWDQGVLLPPLTRSIVFEPTSVLSKLARAAAAAPPFNQSGSVPHGVASGIVAGKNDRFVIATQTCDLVAGPNIEPNIVAMRAFLTDNPKTIRNAGGNSSREFLLDPARGLVVDATVQILVEKPLLLSLLPEPGAPDAERRRRFARWLGHRFDRPVLDDEVVKAVTQPILENLARMDRAGDPDLSALDDVRQVRLARISGDKPYDVHLVFLIDAPLPDGGLALARLVKQLGGWLTPGQAQLASWDALTVYAISAGDLLETDQIYLDHYTYRGMTVQGATPPPPF